jgi:hypothetical protein
MGKPLLWMLIVGLLTFAMYSSAQDAEKGLPEQQFTGRRAGMKALVSSAGRNLGTTGTLALGGVLELACLGWLVMAVQNRNSDGDDTSTKA